VYCNRLQYCNKLCLSSAKTIKLRLQTSAKLSSEYSEQCAGVAHVWRAQLGASPATLACRWRKSCPQRSAQSHAGDSAYDPESLRLYGWRLQEGVYVEIATNPQGRLWSNELQAWIGPWSGEYLRQPDIWLRLFDENGRLIPTRTVRQSISETVDQ
jgi:hypothetical protein